MLAVKCVTGTGDNSHPFRSPNPVTAVDVPLAGVGAAEVEAPTWMLLDNGGLVMTVTVRPPVKRRPLRQKHYVLSVEFCE